MSGGNYGIRRNKCSYSVCSNSLGCCIYRNKCSSNVCRNKCKYNTYTNASSCCIYRNTCRYGIYRNQGSYNIYGNTYLCLYQMTVGRGAPLASHVSVIVSPIEAEYWVWSLFTILACRSIIGWRYVWYVKTVRLIVIIIIIMSLLLALKFSYLFLTQSETEAA